MDTYAFVERWHARIPADWLAEATVDPVDPGTFQRVANLDVIFLPGTQIRGIPEPHLQRLIDQQLIRKLEAAKEE